MTAFPKRSPIQRLSGRTLLTERAGVRSETATWRGQRVFVKTLMVDDAETRARFGHEGRVAWAARHPLVVSPLAVTPTQILFPFVPGGTLRERLERSALTVDEATLVTGGLLAGVVSLHARGITHQDLKPENVLLHGARAALDSVRIIDFGMSHLARQPLDIHRGTRMGTPHFMAPEQFQGVRGDPLSDVYSAGVLLFDGLAGHPPFEDALGWLAGLHADRAPLPGPAALHDLIRRSIAREREQRPQSAAAMYAELSTTRVNLGLCALPTLASLAPVTLPPAAQDPAAQDPAAQDPAAQDPAAQDCGAAR